MTQEASKARKSRDGEEIEAVYVGQGYCYCDVAGKRYGVAEWIKRPMNGRHMDTVRPINPQFATAIRLSKETTHAE